MAKIVPCTMYSSDKTEFPGSSMFVSNSICKVTVRLVVPRTRRLLDLVDDVDGPIITSESTTAVPFISQPFTIWISTCENKIYRKTSVVTKSGLVTRKTATTAVTKIETKTAFAYERDRPLFVTPTAKNKIRTYRKR